MYKSSLSTVGIRTEGTASKKYLTLFRKFCDFCGYYEYVGVWGDSTNFFCSQQMFPTVFNREKAKFVEMKLIFMMKTSEIPIATQASKQANIRTIGKMPPDEAVKLKIIKICTEGPIITLWRYPIPNIRVPGILVVSISLGQGHQSNPGPLQSLYNEILTKSMVYSPKYLILLVQVITRY